MCAPSLKKQTKVSYSISKGKKVKIPVEIQFCDKYVTRRGNLCVNLIIDWAGSRTHWSAYLNNANSLDQVVKFGKYGNNFENPVFVAEVFKAVRDVIDDIDLSVLPTKSFDKPNTKQSNSVKVDSSQTELSLEQQKMINAVI